MTNFTIQVTSDVACPWCYVGRKELQAAQSLWLTSHPSDTFSVTYSPYQLHPDWPQGPSASTPRSVYLKEKFGADRFDQMVEQLGEKGRSLGIDFKMEGNMGNTRDSHRLVELSKKFGGDVESKVLDGLFSANLEHERDITQHDVLKDIAIEAGIPVDDFQKSIVDSDEYGPQVDEAVRQAQLCGVQGVPDFIIQDEYRIPGAVESSTFVEVFVELKKGGH